MRSKLKHAIEYESPALKEYVAPVPTIVLDDVVSLGLYPQIEPYQGYSTEPPAKRYCSLKFKFNKVGLPCHMHPEREALRHAEAGKREHAVR